MAISTERMELIEELAIDMRYAENRYLDSGLTDASEKDAVWDRITAANFNQEEQAELDDWMQSLAV